MTSFCPLCFSIMSFPKSGTLSHLLTWSHYYEVLKCDDQLELGRGFAFIGIQQRISLAGRHYYVDLVFYHRILKCFVLIDLKRGEIQHETFRQKFC
ncbi:MAG: DUF1016 family protein [Prevotella sp.]|nr:DUF1016 family protein [Prevotella sp.]